MDLSSCNFEVLAHLGSGLNRQTVSSAIQTPRITSAEALIYTAEDNLTVAAPFIFWATCYMLDSRGGQLVTFWGLLSSSGLMVGLATVLLTSATPQFPLVLHRRLVMSKDG